MKANEEKIYMVEENHRGEWQPLMRVLDDKSKVQKFVKITDEQAKIMNGQSKYHNIRYVLKEDVKKESQDDEIETLRAEYKAKFEKDADKRWKVDKLKEEIAKA